MQQAKGSGGGLQKSAVTRLSTDVASSIQPLLQLVDASGKDSIGSAVRSGQQLGHRQVARAQVTHKGMAKSGIFLGQIGMLATHDITSATPLEDWLGGRTKVGYYRADLTPASRYESPQGQNL